jgi:cation diffusion facilitator family transporter
VTAGRNASDSILVIGASIAANVAVAATKFAVAVITNSAAMFAEGVHSLANCFDGGLLLFGERRARRPADHVHPFGYGRELFFWSFVVAVIFFALGAGFTLYNGVNRVLNPEPLGDPTWSYVVLAASAVFDGTSFAIGIRAFRRRAPGRGYWGRRFETARIPRSSAPSSRTRLI